MLDFIPVALKNLFSKPATRNYPKVKREPFINERGHIGIDLPSCIFCGLCSRKCPVKAITVTRAQKEWSIDRFKCIMCGECAHSCPKKCLSVEPSYTPPAAVKSVDVFRMPPAEPSQTEALHTGGAAKDDGKNA